VPPEKVGSASSLPQISNELGNALGVAVLGALGTAVYRTTLTDRLPSGVTGDTARTAIENVAGANAVAPTLAGDTAAALTRAAHHAFSLGLHWVAGTAAALLAATAVLVLVKLRHVPTLGAAVPGQAEPAAPEAGTAAGAEAGAAASTETGVQAACPPPMPPPGPGRPPSGGPGPLRFSRQRFPGCAPTEMSVPSSGGTIGGEYCPAATRQE